MLSVDYRMSPEYSIEKSVDDALIAFEYLTSHGFDAHNIIVSGLSAGGGLALLLVLRLKKEKKLPKALILLSPWLDLTLSTKSIAENSHKDILSPESLKYFQDQILKSGSDLEKGSPYLLPPEELTGLPPICLDFGGDESFVDEISGFYHKAVKANIPIKMFSNPGLFHGYHVVCDLFPEGGRSIERIREWILSLKKFEE